MDSAVLTKYLGAIDYTLFGGYQKMETYLYIDILFLLEWLMHFFLLFASGRFCGIYRGGGRILFGSFVASALHIFCLCLILPKQVGLFWSIIFLMIGILLTYSPKTIQHFTKLCLATIFSSFLLGGGLNVYFVMMQQQVFFGTIPVQATPPQNFPWYYLIWSVIVSYILIRKGEKFIRNHIQNRIEFCTVVLKKGDICVEGYALIDTGNHLNYQGRGVAILELSVLLPLFTREENERILKGERDFLIPLTFSSLGNADGGLYGFFVDKCVLKFGGEAIQYEDFFVGIQFDGFVGGYEGLIPPCLLDV